MDYNDMIAATVLHWNYRGFTEFPIHQLDGEEADVTDIYLKDNLITRVPKEIYKLEHLESLYLSGNDITDLPREISMLKCLKCLDLSGNRLKSVPDEIGDVRSLKFLILDENELTELPLRLAELRCLQYLSVCDNKLQWLPQRPVYNYHHCELRFWRNIDLKVIPYSLWYHMFRDQMTRSLNIGCLKFPVSLKSTLNNNCCRLKLSQGSREWDLDIDCPNKYENIQGNVFHSPPSLFELCKRQFYKSINDAAEKLTKYNKDNIERNLSYRINYYSDNFEILERNFEEFNLLNDDANVYDENGNNCDLKHTLKSVNDISKRIKRDKRDYYVPTDVVQKYFNFLPVFIKSDLCNGPISRCENVVCKRPIFDYVHYEFCLGKIILIDNSEEILLSAAFCSKQCAIKWKAGKTVIAWNLIVK